MQRRGYSRRRPPLLRAQLLPLAGRGMPELCGPDLAGAQLHAASWGAVFLVALQRLGVLLW